MESQNEGPISVKFPGAGILDSLEKQVELAKKLKNVYDNRPNPEKFIGLKKNSKNEIYTDEEVKEDIEYVNRTKKGIEEGNLARGNISIIEGGFTLSEMMQAMIVDRINNGMFPKFKAIMTSERDDLRVGIDAVLKRDEGKYLGAAFDFTVSSSTTTITDKLEKEWDSHIERHQIPVVKYFEDPETHEKGTLIVPRFIIGGSKREIEFFASKYLEGKQDELNDHPFKYLMVRQIDEQLKAALKFFDEHQDDPSFGFIRKQYEKIQLFIEDLKEEISYSDFVKTKDFFEYKKNNVAYNAMRNFYETKNG